MKRYGHPIFYPLELVPKDDGEVVLYTDHAAEVEKLEGELVEQARLLGMGGEREAKLMAEVARLQERVRMLEEAANKAEDAMLRMCVEANDGSRLGDAVGAIQAALAQPQPKQKEKGGKP